MKINFDAPPKSAEVSNGIHVNYPAGKRQVPQWRWFLVLALVMLLPGYFFWSLAKAALESDAHGVVVLESVLVRAPASGVVQELVTEGATVQQGQVVALLKHKVRSKEDSESVSGTVSQEDERYERERRSLLEGAVKNEQERVALAENRFNQMQSLFREGAATRQEVDAARMQLLELRSSLQMAMRDLRQSASAVTRQQMSGRSVESIAEVVAPLASVVSQVFAVNGQWVSAGDELLVMDGDETAWIQAYLPPEDLKYAQVGQKATISFQSGEEFEAVVQQVSKEAKRGPASSGNDGLKSSSTALVVKLQPLVDLPVSLRVNNLPVDVHFVSDSWF